MSLDPDQPRFPVATFLNVFDTTPARDVVSLRQIVTGLSRFELKPKYPGKLRAAAERADRAIATWRRGLPAEATRRIEAAIAAGQPPEAAVSAWRAALMAEVMDEGKRGLRLWSPVAYADGSRRTSDGVRAHGALVLDLDHAPDVDAVLDAFSPWFAIAHSTWSYRPDRPKMRVVFPLLTPIASRHWRALWAWAGRRSPSPVDPAGQSESATYALPATIAVDAPRVARIRPGPLLDPIAVGALPADARAPIPALSPPTEPSPFRGFEHDPAWLGPLPSDASLVTDAWSVDDAFDQF